MLQSKGTKLEIFEHVYNIYAKVHICQGWSSRKVLTIEIFEHVYNIMHIVSGWSNKIYEHVYNIMHIVRGWSNYRLYEHVYNIMTYSKRVVQSKGTNLEIFEPV